MTHHPRFGNVDETDPKIILVSIFDVLAEIRDELTALRELREKQEIRRNKWFAWK